MGLCDVHRFRIARDAPIILRRVRADRLTDPSATLCQRGAATPFAGPAVIAARAGAEPAAQTCPVTLIPMKVLTTSPPPHFSYRRSCADERACQGWRSHHVVTPKAPFTRPIGKPDNCADEKWVRCRPAAGGDPLTRRQFGEGESIPPRLAGRDECRSLGSAALKLSAPLSWQTTDGDPPRPPPHAVRRAGGVALAPCPDGDHQQRT
jgi:hypothetical protein